MTGYPKYCTSRRGFLTSAAAFSAWSFMPHIASAAGQRDPRFLTIILRGALDGLAAVAPVGDPHWQSVRDDAILLDSGPNAGLPLDPFFVLNPAMKNFHALYKAKQALVVHAVASPYRERSHFDGQDILESGLPEKGRYTSGWLNRAAAGLKSGEAIGRTGLAVGAVVPLILQGPAAVTAWAPFDTPDVSNDTEARLAALYQHTDPQLHRALMQTLDADALIGANGAAMMGSAMSADSSLLKARFIRAATGAGKFLSEPQGPRIAVLSFDGWDTHSAEGPVAGGRLFALLEALDGAIGALHETMGAVWDDTVISIVTEFGRTVRENGTDGTDHGTGTVAFLLGGPVKGGRIVADWPGLADNQLHMGRDLAPTTDLRAVLKGVMRDHLGLDNAYLGQEVFPQTMDLQPFSGLV